MGRIKLLLFVAAVWIVNAGVVSGAGIEGERNNMGKSLNMFAAGLYKEVSSSESGNIVISPYSAADVLSMVYVGAKGITAEEMSKVMHLPSDVLKTAAMFSAFAADIKKLREKGEVELQTADAVWIEKHFGVLPSYLSLIKHYYNADVFLADFGLPATVEEINSWVSSKTNHKINRLVEKLFAGEKIILCNAVYFKGEWARKFDARLTEKAAFWIRPDKKIKTDMMFRKGKYRYKEFDGFKAVEIPYKGSDIAMILFLPLQKAGMSKLESKIEPGRLNRWIKETLHSPRITVRLALPRFEINFEAKLLSFLVSMGMRHISQGADFSGIDGKKDLCVSAVIQKAMVKVNEEGAEAAAATVVHVCTMAFPPSPAKQFRADHPFLFMIVEKNTQTVLFMGRIADPRES